MIHTLPVQLGCFQWLSDTCKLNAENSGGLTQLLGFFLSWPQVLCGNMQYINTEFEEGNKPTT